MKRKNIFIVSIITIILVAFLNILTVYTVSNGISYWEGYSALNKLRKQKVYLGNNQITDNQDRLITKSQVNNTKAKSILNYLDKNYDYAISWDASNGSHVNTMTMDQKSLEMYPIKVAQGQNLKVRDFHRNKVIPVLVGSKLAKKYPLHHEFTYLDGSTGKRQSYQVAGILTASSSIPSPYLFQNQNYLDNTIIVPLTTYTRAHINLPQIANGIQNLLIFNTNQNQIFKLEKFFKSQDLNVKFYTVQSSIDQEARIVKSALIKLAVGIIILLIVIVVLLKYLIRKDTKMQLKKFISSLIGFGLLLGILIELVLGFSLPMLSIVGIPKWTSLNIILSILSIVLINLLLAVIITIFQRNNPQKQ